MITLRKRKPARVAVLVYVPDAKTYIDQFWGLYESTLISKDNEDTFDFVIIAPQTAVGKLPQKNCHIFSREELSTEEKYRTKYNNEPYRYINSFHHFVDGEVCEFLKNNYEYCFRIDVDTFVTPSAHLLGADPGKVKVGHGGYYGEVPKQHLKAHCSSLGFSFCHDYPIGSTWFGRTNDILEAGKATVEFCEYLINKDSTFVEEEGVWPDWYAGVILLYAGHLAFCKLDHIDVEVFKFDVGVTDDQSVDGAYSLHCWHSHDFFSKFRFAAGQYEDMQSDDWVKTRKASDYAFFCASKGQGNRRKLHLYEGEHHTPAQKEEVSEDSIVRIYLDKPGITINISEQGAVEIRKA
jgi:hypothetical protein